MPKPIPVQPSFYGLEELLPASETVPTTPALMHLSSPGPVRDDQTKEGIWASGWTPPPTPAIPNNDGNGPYAPGGWRHQQGRAGPVPRVPHNNGDRCGCWGHAQRRAPLCFATLCKRGKYICCRGIVHDKGPHCRYHCTHAPDPPLSCRIFHAYPYPFTSGWEYLLVQEVHSKESHHPDDVFLVPRDGRRRRFGEACAHLNFFG